MHEGHNYAGAFVYTTCLLLKFFVLTSYRCLKHIHVLFEHVRKLLSLLGIDAAQERAQMKQVLYVFHGRFLTTFLVAGLHRGG